MLYLIILSLLVTGFIMLPLYMGFWPIGIIAGIIATLIGVGYIYKGDNMGEEGLGTILAAFVAIVMVWISIGIAGIVYWLS
jgi:hypothetical protein